MLGRTRQRVGVLGAGAWGTDIAKVLAERGHRAEMWSHEEAVADEVNTRHTNSHYLMGVKLPEGLKAVTDVRKAVARKDFLLIAVPSPFIIGVVKQILGDPDIVEGKVCVGVLSKGFVETSAGIRLITEAIEDYLPGSYKGNLVYISGPSHAEEVARGKITGLISASRNGTNAIRFRELHSGGTLVLFSSLDVRGVQICAAVKNVIAIGFGILDGLKEFSELFGDNTESLLLRRQRPADVEPLADLWTDPEVTCHLGGPRERARVVASLEETARNPEADPYDLWPVVELATGSVVGHAGLLGKEVEGRPEIELVYVFARPVWGRGYATEIARAVAGHAFGALGLARLISLIEPGNSASERVARKVGMRLEAEIVRPGGERRLLYTAAADEVRQRGRDWPRSERPFDPHFRPR